MSELEGAQALEPAIQPPVGADPDWAEKVDLAIQARLVAAERWKGKTATSPQSWPFLLHRG